MKRRKKTGEQSIFKGLASLRQKTSFIRNEYNAGSWLRAGLALFLCIGMLAGLFAGALGDARAASQNGKNVVRVGWYYNNLFQNGMTDETPKSGYSYEYLQEIAKYNGWEYEYVYGDIVTLKGYLREGTIDLMAGIPRTSDTEEQFLFPTYIMGEERYIVYQNPDYTHMNPGLPLSFDNQAIGAIRGSHMSAELESWRARTGFKCNITYFDDYVSLENAFLSGELDGILTTDNNALGMKNVVPVVSVGAEDYYLAVSRERNDLLRELNYSLKTIEEISPYFKQNLQYKYYGKVLSSVSLTAVERSWLRGHSILKVGYMEDYLPYCKTDEDGNAYGLMVDVLSAALRVTEADKSILVRYTPYENYDDMVNAVRTGEVDMIFPIGGSEWDIDRDGLCAGTEVVTAGMNLVYRGTYNDQTTDIFAINRNNKLQYYFVKQNFPRAQVVEVNSIDECIEAVKTGKASATIINGLRSNLISGNADKELNMLQLEITDKRSFGFKKGESALLLMINRGLRGIGTEYGINASYNYINEFYTYTSRDFLRDYTIELILLAAVVVVFIIFILIVNLRRSRKIAVERAAMNSELTKALNQAQAANNAKSTFLFNMSHDIRTPMNAILGFESLMEKNLDDEEKCRDYLQKIRTSGEVLLSLINNVLEMARIESGKMILVEKPNDIVSIANGLESIFEEGMRKKNITFEKEIQVTHRNIFCDSVKIREIYLNLLSNAMKYTNEGGRIRFSLKESETNIDEYAEYELIVADNGVGMSEEYLPHLFEEFSREHSSIGNKIEGTGLGMPIVKKLVELMNGTISVESKLGEGTTFCVKVLHRIATPEDCEPETVEPMMIQKVSASSILLAEDNDLNAEIAIAILEEEGFRVTRVEDGEEVLRTIEEAPAGTFDLILMDIQMPKMDGYTATRKIREMEDSAKAHIPIVAMTANAFERDKRNAYEAGMNGHVAKPIEPNELMQNIAKNLS